MKSLNPNTNKAIKTVVVEEQQNITYQYYAPKHIKKVLVLVHGISRNAEEIINQFSQLADAYGYLLIAPLFSQEFSSDYQRLGRKHKGPRSDYQLLGVLNNCQKLLGINFNKFDLFGFSAGAQYAHRFAFAHPNRVNKVALTAAGWYTLPTTDLAYPYGTRLKSQFTDIKFEPLRYLRVGYKVFVGSEDNKRDIGLNKNPKIDLIQGKNRINRAKNWVELMHLQMTKHAIENNIAIEILPNVEHDFLDCASHSELIPNIFNWLVAGEKNA